MSEQIREEFESWAQNCGYTLKLIVQQDGLGTEIYASGLARSAWLGWQASRQALAVELPKGEGDECGHVVSLADVEDALDKAGVSYR